MLNFPFQQILEFLKLGPRYLVALCLVTAFFLFIPKGPLERFGLNNLAQDYRPWFGVVFIVTLTLLLVTAIFELAKWCQRWWRKRKFYLRIQQRLLSLTEDEKQILRFYIAEQTKTNVLRIDDGTVQGLSAAGIIYRTSSLGNLAEGFAFNISDHAWNFLNIYPSLLEGTTNTYRTDRRFRLRRW